MDEPIDVDVPVRVTSPLNGQHSSWGAVTGRRTRERARTLAALETAATAPQAARKRARAWGAWIVTLERHGVRRMDGDNLQAGLKSVRDAIAAWLGVDDADERVWWRYAQVLDVERAAESYLRVHVAPDPICESRRTPTPRRTLAPRA